MIENLKKRCISRIKIRTIWKKNPYNPYIPYNLATLKLYLTDFSRPPKLKKKLCCGVRCAEKFWDFSSIMERFGALTRSNSRPPPEISISDTYVKFLFPLSLSFFPFIFIFSPQTQLRLISLPPGGRGQTEKYTPWTVVNSVYFLRCYWRINVSRFYRDQRKV